MDSGMTGDGQLPHVAAYPALSEAGHRASQAQNREDMVFGTLDGVITAIALAVSVGGVLSSQSSIQVSHNLIFLTIIAAGVAGSLSMFTGALLSARARANLVRRERIREEREVDERPDEERAEVYQIYRARGFTEEEAQMATRRITEDKNRWIDMMMVDELGLEPAAQPVPLRHALIIGGMYLVGGILPALPFLLESLPIRSDTYLAVAIGSVVLVSVGVSDARLSETSWLRGAGEVLLIGLGTALAVYLVTLAFV